MGSSLTEYPVGGIDRRRERANQVYVVDPRRKGQAADRSRRPDGAIPGGSEELVQRSLFNRVDRMEPGRVPRTRSVVGIAGRRSLLFCWCPITHFPPPHPPLRARFAARAATTSVTRSCVLKQEIVITRYCRIWRVFLRPAGCGRRTECSHEGVNECPRAITCTDARSVEKSSTHPVERAVTNGGTIQKYTRVSRYSAKFSDLPNRKDELPWSQR